MRSFRTFASVGVSAGILAGVFFVALLMAWFQAALNKVAQ